MPQRRLKQVNITLTEEINAVKRQRACELLCETTLFVA
jgi:hypothetical protein